MTTTTTKYERWGLKKRRKRKDEGRGMRDEGECKNNDNENKNVGDFVQKALYYNVLFACRVSNTTLFIRPKIIF